MLSADSPTAMRERRSGLRVRMRTAGEPGSLVRLGKLPDLFSIWGGRKHVLGASGADNTGTLVRRGHEDDGEQGIEGRERGRVPNIVQGSAPGPHTVMRPLLTWTRCLIRSQVRRETD
jgi:hypothetical protein